MKRFTRAVNLALGMLVAAFAAGCDSSQNVTAPHADPTNSEFVAFETSVVSQAQASGIDPEAPAPSVMPQMSGGRGWVFVQGSAGDASVEAVIDRRGGVLNLGNHWLLVPRDAVRSATRFRMTPISDGTFHVDLTATTVRSRGGEVENDAGQAGFRKPVYLAFHFGGLPIDPASLNVAWLTTGGRLVPQQTFIYDQDWAVGVLRHFSGYVLVGN